MDDGHIKNTSIDGIVMSNKKRMVAGQKVVYLTVSGHSLSSDNNRSIGSDLKPNRTGLNNAIIVIVVALLLAIGLFLWQINNSKPDHKTVQVGISRSFVDASNNFGINLFRNLTNSSVLGNGILISPSAVASSLTMLTNGYSGNVLAVTKIMGYGNTSITSLNQSNQALYGSLGSSNLTINNGLWVNRQYSVRSKFINLTKRYYPLSIYYFNSKQGLARSLDSWSIFTKQKLLSSIEPRLSPDDSLDLISATSFDGQWSKAFRADSGVSPFTLSNGQNIKVGYMTRTGYFNYFHDSTLTSLQIPYGQNQQLSMDIFLPNNMRSFLGGINATLLNNIVNRYQPIYGSLVMPIFSLANQVELNKILANNMGLSSMFHKAALGGLASSINLTKFINIAAISVGQSGFESNSGSSLNQQAYFNLQLNKPFVFSVVDNSTNDILFIGLVNNPN